MESKPPPRHRKWWYSAALLSICAAAMVVYGVSGRSMLEATRAGAAAASLGASTPRVQLVRAEVRGGKRTMTQLGSILSFESVDLCAMVSGYLKIQEVDIGSHIIRGEILAVIDVPREESTVAEAAALLEQAKAHVSQAESKVETTDADKRVAAATAAQMEADIDRLVARHEFAEAQYARVKQLAEKRAVDKKLVDEQKRDFESAVAAERTARLTAETAKAQLAAAASRVEQAKADVVEARTAVSVADARWAKARVNLSYATITAPFDGVVTRRNFHPGAYISAHTDGGREALLTVARTDLMRVVVQVPDRDVVLTNPGDSAVLTVDGLDGRVFQGTVSRIANSEDPKTRTMRVEIDLENHEGLLRDGMYGHATIELAASVRRLMLPHDCVLDRTAKDDGAVFVVRKGKVERVAVELGADDGTRVEVKSGISADDDVVRAPDPTLKPGMRVDHPSLR